MKNYFNEIENKLKKHIEFEKIKIVDNSYKHVKHKSFSPGKLHLQLIIKSIYLNSIPRINAQRLIMKILRDDLNTKIHALEINIEK
tara:strand:- start:833 stop:1090 length:258 start_codon:yes stop_codon:yes gene_type:complete